MINRFLHTQEDDLPITKYLEMTVIEFLGTSTAHFIEENDISVTKFLETALNNFLLDDSVVAQFLQENDITVTKFMAYSDNDLAVSKFLSQDSHGCPCWTANVSESLNGDCCYHVF